MGVGDQAGQGDAVQDAVLAAGTKIGVWVCLPVAKPTGLRMQRVVVFVVLLLLLLETKFDNFGFPPLTELFTPVEVWDVCTHLKLLELIIGRLFTSSV